MCMLYTDDLHTFTLCRQHYSNCRGRTHSVHNPSSDCQPILKNAGTTEDNRRTSGCSPARSSEGKALCKEDTDCCKAIIVTVCNNPEVINQLVSAVHSSALIQERVNGRIQQSKLLFFSFSNICVLYLPVLPTHRCGGLFRVLLHSFLHFFLNSTDCSPSILTGFLHAASLPARLQAALQTVSSCQTSLPH